MKALGGSSFVISDAIRLLTADRNKKVAAKGLNESPWLTVREAADRAKCGIKLIYREVKAERLQATRVSGRRTLRFLAEWIDAWLLDHRVIK